MGHWQTESSGLASASVEGAKRMPKDLEKNGQRRGDGKEADT